VIISILPTALEARCLRGGEDPARPDLSLVTEDSGRFHPYRCSLGLRSSLKRPRLWGFAAVGLVLFHGVGLHGIFVHQKRRERLLRLGRPNLAAGAFLFGWSVFLMLILHVVEILIWAFALTHMGLVKHAYDAIYFCANAYTTLGMGNMDVDEHWRNISPVIGISGLFTFAWTTSALVDVVSSNGRLLERLEDERESEMHLRFALRKEEWDAMKGERDAERSEREKTRKQASGAPFFQRLKIWKEERRRQEELRSAGRAEIEDLRRKEHQNEEKLGSAEPPAGSEDKEQK
jgi:Ion channel